MASTEGPIQHKANVDSAAGTLINRDVKESRPTTEPQPAVLDIEHAVVQDDPRLWSKGRKYSIVALISAAAILNGLSPNIYNPALSQIESELHATSNQLSVTLAVFILIQGSFSTIWSAISEIQGRKFVYLISIAVYTVGCIVAATSKTIQVLIGMRCLQAVGSSAVIGIGAATLADIYEPHERGTMVGIYYCAPLLGPSLGPILGGVLRQVFNWRATFWFLSIFTALSFLGFIPFKDTFRKERSVAYQVVLRHVLEQQAARRTELSQNTNDNEKDDLTASEPTKEIKLTLKDVSPVGPIIHILRRWNNITMVFANALLFAFNYSITYTATRTLENQYGYNALKPGLVLLAYGMGCLVGSILGGRYSDYIFLRVKAAHGGLSNPEMRLESTKIFMLFFPPSVIAYGWVSERHANVAAVCVMLFLCGFFPACMYSSTIAYILDSNVGRSSSAVATNSFFRGLTAFVATEVAVPLQDSIGDGGLYSLWCGLAIVCDLLIVLVCWKGRQWRERAVAKEVRRAGKSV